MDMRSRQPSAEQRTRSDHTRSAMTGQSRGLPGVAPPSNLAMLGHTILFLSPERLHTGLLARLGSKSPGHSTILVSPISTQAEPQVLVHKIVPHPLHEASMRLNVLLIQVCLLPVNCLASLLMTCFKLLNQHANLAARCCKQSGRHQHQHKAVGVTCLGCAVQAYTRFRQLAQIALKWSYASLYIQDCKKNMGPHSMHALLSMASCMK